MVRAATDWIGLDEARDVGFVEGTVGVGDEGQGQSVDARIAGQFAGGQLGQLSVVAAWQVVANLAKDAFDDVKVVEQPFGIGTERFAAAGHFGNAAVGGHEDALVLPQSAQQRSFGAVARRSAAACGQLAGMSFQRLQTVQLGADWFFAVKDHGGQRWRLVVRNGRGVRGKRLRRRYTHVPCHSCATPSRMRPFIPKYINCRNFGAGNVCPEGGQ